MNSVLTTALPSAFHFIAALVGESAPAAPRDLTDPAETPDRHGLRCELHGCAREIGEAPFVRATPAADAFAAVKRRAFPQSWTAIAAVHPPRTGWFRRPRLAVVRYCPECRDAAVAWLAEHGAE